MANLLLTTQGVEVGYDEDGFYALGTTVAHRFENEDWKFTTPNLRGMPIQWRLDLKEENLFERYKSCLWKTEDQTPRVPLLEDYFVDVKQPPVASLQRWDQKEPLELHFSFPNDPSLAAMITGAVVADRELSFWSQGWLFTTEDKPAPAVSVEDFMESQEPSFSLQLPVMRIK
jgi:hypothetical protein